MDLILPPLISILFHGLAFAMGGAYVAVTLMNQYQVPFGLALAGAFLAAALAGAILERTLYARLYGASELEQVLFTIGLIFMAGAIARKIFGPVALPVRLPALLSGQLDLGFRVVPLYRAFLIGVSFILIILLWLGIERTRFGASLRASVNNRRMAESIGIDTSRLFTLFPALTMLENIRLAVAEHRAVAARGTPGGTVEKLYALFPNLAGRRRGMGHELSGGEQQMLAIGRALMGNPSLLLLDEPLERLAPVVAARVFDALRQLRAETNITMILTGQQAHQVLGFSDRAIILDRGRIVHDAASADLLADPDTLASLIGVTRAGLAGGGARNQQGYQPPLNPVPAPAP